MRLERTTYVVGFAAAVCVICSLFVASSATVLKPRQDSNAALDKQKNVLAVSGLTAPDAELDAAAVEKLFAERIRPVYIDMETKTAAPESEIPANYSPARAVNDPALSFEAPPIPRGSVAFPSTRLFTKCWMNRGKKSPRCFQLWGRGCGRRCTGLLRWKKTAIRSRA